MKLTKEPSHDSLQQYYYKEFLTCHILVKSIEIICCVCQFSVLFIYKELREMWMVLKWGKRDGRNIKTVRLCIFLHVNLTPFTNNIYSFSHWNAKKAANLEKTFMHFHNTQKLVLQGCVIKNWWVSSSLGTTMVVSLLLYHQQKLELENKTMRGLMLERFAWDWTL